MSADQAHSLAERMVNKFTSGRLISTVLVNVVLAVGIVKGMELPGEFWAIVGMINTHYFSQRGKEMKQ